MAGRTHLQHALPCTFGYKCAVYLSGILRHMERLREVKHRCLLVQFGGAAGTLASLGSAGDGIQVRAQLAKELGLRDPAITWHTVRDTVAEVLNFLALLGGSLGKIAFDIVIMSSNEFGEVAESFVLHRGASSTMPQKRNPIPSETVVPTWQSQGSLSKNRGKHVVLDGLFISLGYLLQAWLNLAFYTFKVGPVTLRAPIAIPILFSILLLSSVFFFPESPR